MSWTERRLTSRLGVALSGVRADGDLSAAELDRIRRTVFAHGVLLLPEQALSDDALFAFAEAVGKVVPTPNISGAPQDRVLPLTNLDGQGRLRPPEDMWVRRNQANEQWHADLTFMRPRASISILYGRTVTTAGGNTEFCDMRLAWEALSPAEQARLEPLVARHTMSQSRRKYGTDNFNEDDHRRYPPVERPLVDRHRPTGRKALMVGSNIASVGGLDETASAAFLADLTARATTAENVYSHRWAAGDLLLWDNRCVLHRVTPYDSATQPRDLRAVRLYEPADA
jgi:alpha-ketoglutarate-dependent 2,4-dichlorophenoxyacetate dioxygenase